MILVSMACEARGDGVPALWAGSEPVWPTDEAGRLWEAFSIASDGAAGSRSWPVSLGEICGKAMGSGPGESGIGAIRILHLLRAHCQDKVAPHPFGIDLDAGAYSLERKYPFGRPFEEFYPGWGSVLVDPEIGQAWSRVPAAVKTELRYPVSPRSFAYFRLGLRRDLAAWHDDPLGSNLPLSGKEVDLNEPSLGYFHAETEAFSFTVGRFPVHWSSSPDFGLALSQAVPFHNAAEFALRMPRARYRLLVSSLNPWLEGTPAGDSASENYPYGSEEYRQRRYPDGNGSGVFHKRVYAERSKTLFAHRVEADLGRLALGITETQIIGGKAPDLRDAGAFVFFHNDFKDGFTNLALSFDAALRLPAGISLAGEFYMDDVQFSETEGEGNTASIFGYMGAIRHGFSLRGWTICHGLHAVRTDPYMYGYLQPLNTMTSRHILASNYQHDGDPVFVDRFVVDYPLGYLRGGDAYDFWYRLEAWRGARLRLKLEAAWLAQGEVDVHTPYETYYSSRHDSPTGTVEREIRLRLEGEYRFGPGLSAQASAAWQGIRNQGHISGEDAQRFQVGAGIAWAIRH